MTVISRRRRLIVTILRALWVLVILFNEYGAFLHSIRGCEWPDLPTSTSASSSRPYHVLLVADPQIIDSYSYPRRSFFLSYLTRLMVDLNMRKNWQMAIGKRPDAVVFLGNAMDSGRVDMPETEYEALFRRFFSIFRVRDDTPMHFIPGNHDIGLGVVSSFVESPEAYERYVAHFGQSNREISVANHTLVLFDAPSYVDEDSKRHGRRMPFEKWTPIRDGSYEYVNTYVKEEHTDPVIFFSHIPFFRPDGKSCGPLRERGTLRPGAGEGYQNTMERDSTRRLLEAFKPVAVFSGDDHDYCEYTHHIQLPQQPTQNVREVTVRTLSMAMNVKRPGFQLLSLLPDSLREASRPSFADTPCLLPDQFKIYLGRYLPLLVISILILFISNINFDAYLGSAKSSPAVPDQRFREDEDDEGELDEESGPLSSSSAYNLPSASNHHKRSASRSTPSPGWRMTQSPTRRQDGPLGGLRRLFDTAWAYIPGGSKRLPGRRRGWWQRCIRDIRDVAIFPVGVFVVINWWVVTK